MRRQTEGQEDKSFTNPAGHVAEPPGGAHQVGLPLKQGGMHSADTATGTAAASSEPLTGGNLAESLKSAFGVSKE